MESLNILRLKTGEDIICYMEQLSSEEVVVRDAMAVVVKTDLRSGHQAIMMQHWLPVGIIENNEAVIKLSDVLTIINPSVDFNEFYENSIATYKRLKEAADREDDEEELTQEDMKTILETVNPSDNLMH